MDSTRGPTAADDGGASRRAGPAEGSSARLYDMTLRSRSVLGGGAGSGWQSFSVNVLHCFTVPFSSTKDVNRSTGSMLTRYTTPLAVRTHACAPWTVLSLGSAGSGR